MTETEKKQPKKWLYPIYGGICGFIIFIFVCGSEIVTPITMFLKYLTGTGWGLLILPHCFIVIGISIGMLFFNKRIGLALLSIMVAFIIHPIILTLQELHQTNSLILPVFLKHLNNSENGQFISGIFFIIIGTTVITCWHKKWWGFVLIIIVVIFSLQPAILTYQQLHYNKEEIIKKWDLLTIKEIASRYNLTEWQVSTPFLGKHENIRYYDLGDGEWRYKRKLIENLLKKDGFIKNEK